MEKRKDRHKYEIIKHHTGECIYLPNSIADGQAGHQYEPALKRLLEHCKPDLRSGININDARTDAMLLLLQLYSVHNLDMDGGVSPNVWHCIWTCSEQKEDFENSRVASSIGDQTFDFFPAQAGREIFNPSLIEDMFRYIEDELQRNRRIDRALKNLRELRFLYQIVQIWQRPCNINGIHTLQYPLHIFDKSQRDRDEPAVGPKFAAWLENRRREIDHIIAESSSVITSKNEETELENSSDDSEYIFFLTARGLSLLPLTSLRLRYRPLNADTVAGMAEQQRMADFWLTNLDSLQFHISHRMVWQSARFLAIVHDRQSQLGCNLLTVSRGCLLP